jgi:adenylate kinase
MMTGITGTPGTGKSAAADVLATRGHRVVHLGGTVAPYVIGEDRDRGTEIVDHEAWAAAFSPVDGIVEGHLAHFLPCDRVVVLRCRPDVLVARLRGRGYPEAKCRENAEAEALDVILVETLERHPEETVRELDTTASSREETAARIEDFIAGRLAPEVGTVDWSDYFLEAA